MRRTSDTKNVCFLDMNPLPSLEPLSQSPTDNQPLVLIYSQEPDTRFLFRTLLEIWNYRVIEADSFEDSIFITENKKPDLVLMDTSIGLIENLTIMRQLREKTLFSEMPFILLSGHSQTRFRNLALALGAQDFLVKPIDFDLLENSLKKNIRGNFSNNI